MRYLSPILNATLDSAHQNFLFSPIICHQNNHKDDNLFRQIYTTKKKNGCIIFLLTLAYSQIVKSFLPNMTNCVIFSKKKPLIPLELEFIV